MFFSLCFPHFLNFFPCSIFPMMFTFEYDKSLFNSNCYSNLATFLKLTNHAKELSKHHNPTVLPFRPTIGHITTSPINLMTFDEIKQRGPFSELNVQDGAIHTIICKATHEEWKRAGTVLPSMTVENANSG